MNKIKDLLTKTSKALLLSSKILTSAEYVLLKKKCPDCDNMLTISNIKAFKFQCHTCRKQFDRIEIIHLEDFAELMK